MQDSPEPGRPKYRPDIDGLRGIAVLAVVAFHAFPGTMRAGFIGVDVFFVISGYLITTIILGALERGNFSFGEFYARRIRRIFPALIVILTAVFVAGWYTLMGGEFKRLGLEMVGGATFTSNLILLGESGYFDVASELKPLLHLWSLAIEEQFYLLFPLVLWASHKRRMRPVAVIAAVGLASFVWNVSVASAQPELDFYSPQTRVWELMIGAAVAGISLRPPRRWPSENVLGEFSSIVGASLLVFGLVFIAREDVFPGWWALLPTLGAALLISGGAKAWINRRILSDRVLVWFGLISFPLYLWHWPLLSFSRIVAGETPSWAFRSLMVATAVVLAWLTYRFIERPLRFGKGVWTTDGLLVPLVALGFMGISVYWAEGFASRSLGRRLDSYLQSIKVASAENACVRVDAPGWFCKVGVQDAAPAAFIFGDSHAGSLLPAFGKVAQETGGSFLYALTKACVAEEPCLEDNRRIFEYVRDNRIPSVVIALRWSSYDHPVARDTTVTELQAWLDRTVDAYRGIGVHVYLFTDNPVQRYMPADILRKSRNDDVAINEKSVTTAEYATQRKRLTAILSRYAGDSVTVLDFTDAYCRKDICPLVKDGRFLYGDLNHVSVDGSMLVYPELKKALGD